LASEYIVIKKEFGSLMGVGDMKFFKRLSKIFQSAEQIPFDDSSRIVLMSDCHRGDGSSADEFSKNQNIYFTALNHYYNENYTYIEIGDGDELWENSKISDIVQVHSDAFWLLSKFFKEGRFHCLFGNHDMVKKYNKYVMNNLYRYYDEPRKKEAALFEGIRIHEGLVLRHRITGNKIFIVHGHQVDYFNYDLWRLTKFLARYLWRPLNSFGVNDPTRAAKNFSKKEKVEKRLIEWILKEDQMLIAGHTHRPMFPETGEPPYFNDGSCVHPRCITAIEIVNGSIALVKWNVKSKADGSLFIGRTVLAGPRKLKDYFMTE
jgi:UDP-2,3-diacylglucosamine pyrophosphatase LpxH